MRKILVWFFEEISNHFPWVLEWWVFGHPQSLQYHIHQQDMDDATIFTREQINKWISIFQKRISNQIKERKKKTTTEWNVNWSWLNGCTRVTLVLSEQTHSIKLLRVLCIVVVVLLPLPKVFHCKCMCPSILDYSILFQDVSKWTNYQVSILTSPIKQIQTLFK